MKGCEVVSLFNNIFVGQCFIMMIGLPGSGKSTIAKEIANEIGASIFSSDDYRLKLLGDVNDQSNNSLVFDTLQKDLIIAIQEGKNVIFDATNVTLKSRLRVLQLLSKYDVMKVAYHMNTSYEQCIINDKKRERSVGDAVIKKFLERYQCPQYFEGFDEIVLHSQFFNKHNEYIEDDATSILLEMFNFDQKNPHHVHTVGRHCRLLAEQCDD